MKNLILFIVLISSMILLTNIELIAQSICGTTEGVSSTTPYKPTQSPAQNEYLKILIVYIRFADDNILSQSGFWNLPNQKPVSPNGGLPLLSHDEVHSGFFMDRYPEYTYSDYFCEMSMGKLDVIGDEVMVNLDEPCSYYMNPQNNLNNYGKLNRHILEEYVNNRMPNVNFADYDNWKFENEQWVFEPDNTVDMIVMNYRNFPCGSYWFWEYGAGAYGEASLGHNNFGTLTLDGKNINGTWNHDGSGVTAIGKLHNYSGVTAVVEHEISHNFFVTNLFKEVSFSTPPPCKGTNSSTHSSIGLMASSHEDNSYCMSPSERSCLTVNYITPTEPYNGWEDWLGDYIVTGNVLKIAIPNSNPQEYFWVANHQKVSVYDGISKGGVECWNINYGLQDPKCDFGKGLFIYHESCKQDIKTTDIENADGKYDWVLDRWVPNFRPPWGNIPLFEPIAGNYLLGKGEFLESFGQGSQWVTDNPCEPEGVPNEYRITLDYIGEGLDAYNVGYDEIFSPWSNPASNSNSNSTNNSQITIRLLEKNAQTGAIKVKVYLNNDVQALEECPPSKPKNLKVTQEIINQQTGQFHPKLNWDDNNEPDVIFYGIYRGSTNDCYIEPTQYTLIETVNEGVNEYIDDEVTLYPSQSGWASCQYQFISFSYKIYALDDFYQSLLSDRSIINGYTSPCDETDGFNLPEVNNPKTFSAYNYPNPFNPVTEIRYSIWSYPEKVDT